MAPPGVLLGPAVHQGEVGELQRGAVLDLEHAVGSFPREHGVLVAAAERLERHASPRDDVEFLGVGARADRDRAAVVDLGDGALDGAVLDAVEDRDPHYPIAVVVDAVAPVVGRTREGAGVGVVAVLGGRPTVTVGVEGAGVRD